MESVSKNNVKKIVIVKMGAYVADNFVYVLSPAKVMMSVAHVKDVSKETAKLSQGAVVTPTVQMMRFV